MCQNERKLEPEPCHEKRELWSRNHVDEKEKLPELVQIHFYDSSVALVLTNI